MQNRLLAVIRHKQALEKETGHALEPEWRLVTGAYKLKQHLGRGSSGEVVLARHRETKDLVAIKLVRIVDHPKFYTNLLRELKIMKALSGETGRTHVPQIREIILEDSQQVLFIVMEYIPLTLFDILQESKAIKLEESHIVKIMHGLLRSLRYLHDANIIHRDIKPSNILVTTDLDVYICDFGISRFDPRIHSSCSPV